MALPSMSAALMRRFGGAARAAASATVAGDHAISDRAAPARATRRQAAKGLGARRRRVATPFSGAADPGGRPPVREV